MKNLSIVFVLIFKCKLKVANAMHPIAIKSIIIHCYEKALLYMQRNTCISQLSVLKLTSVAFKPHDYCNNNALSTAEVCILCANVGCTCLSLDSVNIQHDCKQVVEGTLHPVMKTALAILQKLLLSMLIVEKEE